MYREQERIPPATIRSSLPDLQTQSQKIRAPPLNTSRLYSQDTPPLVHLQCINIVKFSRSHSLS
jgi:hypothetical protein